jgi:glycosyltransferase involved in cell wall biosynthesis
MTENPEQKKSLELTIIIPVYNEVQAIAATVQKLKDFVSPLGWKILTVNDGSKDESKEVLDAIPGIIVCHHKVNKGYGASLKTGISNATTEYVAFYDADGQHNPQDLINLANSIDDYDMVIGDRGKKFYSTPMRTPGKWVLKQVAQILVGVKIPDLNSGLRVVRKDKIKDVVHLCPNGFSFSTTSTIAFFNNGSLVKYYPIHVENRIGKSSVKIFKHGFQTIILMMRLISLFNPLKIFMPTAIGLMMVSVLYQIYTIFTIGWHVVGGALLSFIAGLIIFFVGILADQISALRLENHYFLKQKE